MRNPTLIVMLCAACGASGPAPSAEATPQPSPTPQSSPTPPPTAGPQPMPTPAPDPDPEPGPQPQPAGAPMFVIGGYDLRRMISSDGAHWTHDVSDPPGNPELDNILGSVAFGNGLIVATGNRGAFTSPDGVTWTHVPSPMPQEFPGIGGGGVVFDGSKFVAVASDRSFVSPDGVTWSIAEETGYAVHWRLAAGNGHLVAVGDYGQSGVLSKVSEDGLVWHDLQIDEGAPVLNALAFGAGRFVAGGARGHHRSSADGVVWDHDVTEGTSFGDFSTIAYGNGVFLGCVYYGCYRSTNGDAWTVVSQSAPIDAVVFGAGKWVGINWYANIYVSDDGAAWDNVYSGGHDRPPFQTVAFGYVN